MAGVEAGVMLGRYEDQIRGQHATARVLRQWFSLTVNFEYRARGLAIDDELPVACANVVSANGCDGLREKPNRTWHIPSSIHEVSYAFGNRECNEVASLWPHGGRNPVNTARNARGEVDEQMPGQKNLGCAE
jgi:hypothetical protein